MTEAKEKISDYRPQARNPNKHNQRGMGQLENSIRGDGWIGAMTAAADGEMIAGSARLEKSAEVFGVDAEPIVIESDGSRPIVVKRTDLPSADDPRAKRLSIADNRIQEVDLTWDTEVLQGFAEFDGIDLGDWWRDGELISMGIMPGEDIDYEQLWQGMPEFKQEGKKPFQSLIVHFITQEMRDEFSRVVNQSINDKTKYIYYPKQEREPYGVVDES